MLKSSCYCLSAIGLNSTHVCCVQSLQSCPTLCDPMDCSPPGSSVHGILQARTRVSCCALLQGIFPTQGLNLRLLPPLHWQVVCFCFFFFFTTSNTWEALNSTRIHIFLSLSLALVLEQLITKYSNISHPPFCDFSWNFAHKSVSPFHFILHLLNTSLDNAPWQSGQLCFY